MAKKRTMSDDHKAALAKGREQGRAVRNYLEAIDGEKRRGPKMTPERLQAKLDDVNGRIELESDPSRRLELIQTRLDTQDRLKSAEETVDMDGLEADFVAAAKEYSERKGISYTAWREIGVSAAALKAAGVPRTRRTS